MQQLINLHLCSKLFIVPDTVSILRRSAHLSMPPALPRQSSSATPIVSLCPEPNHYQNIIVMRHGDRMDNLDKSWLPNAIRKWDPPLHDEGHARAVSAGQSLLTSLGYPIHRVFVSPFLRCLQTASHVALALCTAPQKNGINISDNPSKIKVSIQYGLSEMFNNKAIWDPPKEGQEWGLVVSELENELPPSTVDTTCEQVNAELPKWGETKDDARARYEGVIRTLADKYPCENLLLVTHGEGLEATVATFMKDVKIRNIEYCGYLNLRREIRGGKESIEAEEFELLADQSVGMTFTSLRPSHL